MRSLSGKKLLLLGFIVILLILIPVLIFFVKQQQDIRSRAQKSTTLSFSPESSATSPIVTTVGEEVSLDVTVDPGQNQVSFIRLEIDYDPTKLATAEAEAFVQNSQALTLLEGPIYSSGKIAATLSVGADPSRVIQTATKVGTLRLKAIGATATPTQVSFTTTTQVLSTGATDQANEDVLATRTPAYIQINPATGDVTPTVTPRGTITPSPTRAATTTPTIPGSTTAPTPTSGGGVGAANVAPSCSGLSADATTGTIPLSVTFTATGSDSDGSLSKATFNFGDGTVQDVTDVTSGQASIAHTYSVSGTYTASVIFTDNAGATSATGICTLTINAQASATTTVLPTETPGPTLEAGPGETILGIGAIVALITIIGGILFFTL